MANDSCRTCCCVPDSTRPAAASRSDTARMPRATAVAFTYGPCAQERGVRRAVSHRGAARPAPPALVSTASEQTSRHPSRPQPW